MDNIQFSYLKNTLLILVFPLLSCGKVNSASKINISTPKQQIIEITQDSILTGAQQTSAYLETLKGKQIAIVGNPTSVVFSSKHKAVHLVDTLLSHNINIKKVFAPEHGFRGTVDAGEVVKDGIDLQTGLVITSLYGKNKKPSAEMLAGLDMVIFDIQDVGARFYTYISTLHYIMEACAEENIPVLILDRPNPNGHYVDGPVLDMKYKSFVGMHPVPIVHGMTIGEYAQMINGEKWLKNGIQCAINVIPLKNYTHQTPYSLPIKPSPNLPNDTSINLYPSLCLFEGTSFSVGRGTDMQFQVFGSPKFLQKEFYFTPKPNLGAKNPKFNTKICYGRDLRNNPVEKMLNFTYIIEAYESIEEKTTFFTPFFTTLAGNKILQEQIESGKNTEQIRNSWQTDLDAYKMIRTKYLLYP